MNTLDRIESYQRTFPKWPAPMYDGKRMSGIWIMGNSYRGSGYYGSYPATYLKRVFALFPEARQAVHLFSGSLDPEKLHAQFPLQTHVCIDIKNGRDAHAFSESLHDCELIIADPPYSPEDAAKYGYKMINRRKVFLECWRALRPGGNLVWLDTSQPMFSADSWKWWGAIGIIVSTNHRYRFVTFYEKILDS